MDRQEPPREQEVTPATAAALSAIEVSRATALLSDLDPLSPFRLPSWRWVLAQVLIDSPLSPFRRLADAPVHQAVAYLLARDRFSNIDESDRQACGMADIHAAFSLFTKHLSMQRWVVESRILANEPSGQIARKSGLTESAVRTFEAVFFHVRHRLKQTAYIQHAVIRVRPSMGLVFLTDETLLKVCAFRGGVHVLEALLNADDQGRKGDVKSLASTAVSARLVGLWRAVLALPVNEKTATGVLKLYKRSQEIEHQEKARTIGPVTVAVTPSFGAWITSQDESLARSIDEQRQGVDDQTPGIPDGIITPSWDGCHEATFGFETHAGGRGASRAVRDSKVATPSQTCVAVA